MSSERRSDSPKKWLHEGFKTKKEYETWKVESGVQRDEFERSQFWEFVGSSLDTAFYEIPPGPALVPLRYNINFAKLGMPVLIFSLMVYFDNFSVAAWIYFCLHGSYGIIWVLRDVVFPDPGFLRKQTFLSMLQCWPIFLIPYAIPTWQITSRQAPQNPSIERIVVCFWLYVFGIVFMVVTDAQKYLILRERQHGKGGLITHSMCGWSRNMNYLGEMMLYSSFGILCQMPHIWYVFAYMWGIVFVLRMKMKDYSLSKKVGWCEYKARTWLILPKIYNCTYLSVAIYGFVLGAAYYCYTHGGIEKGFKSAFLPGSLPKSEL